MRGFLIGTVLLLSVASGHAVTFQVPVTVDDATLGAFKAHYGLSDAQVPTYLQVQLTAMVEKVARDQGRDQTQRLHDALNRLDAQARDRAIVAALAAVPGLPDPRVPPVEYPEPGRQPDPLLSAAPLGLVAGALALGVDSLWWLGQIGFAWFCGYLLWEMKPMRRVLFGVARRLYRRSWDD